MASSILEMVHFVSLKLVTIRTSIVLQDTAEMNLLSVMVCLLAGEIQVLVLKASVKDTLLKMFSLKTD